jgi:hypothetical protein
MAQVPAGVAVMAVDQHRARPLAALHELPEECVGDRLGTVQAAPGIAVRVAAVEDEQFRFGAQRLQLGGVDVVVAHGVGSLRGSGAGIGRDVRSNCLKPFITGLGIWVSACTRQP